MPEIRILIARASFHGSSNSFLLKNRNDNKQRWEWLLNFQVGGAFPKGKIGFLWGEVKNVLAWDQTHAVNTTVLVTSVCWSSAMTSPSSSSLGCPRFDKPVAKFPGESSTNQLIIPSRLYQAHIYLSFRYEYNILCLLSVDAGSNNWNERGRELATWNRSTGKENKNKTLFTERCKNIEILYINNNDTNYYYDYCYMVVKHGLLH